MAYILEDNLATSKGTIAIRFDTEVGILRICASGILEYRELHRYLKEASSFSTIDLSNGDIALVLFDFRNADIRDTAADAYVPPDTSAFYRPSDRIAMLVKSSLDKWQLRKAVGTEMAQQMFISENAALTWLTAYDRKGSAPGSAPQVGQASPV